MFTVSVYRATDVLPWSSEEAEIELGEVISLVTSHFPKCSFPVFKKALLGKCYERPVCQLQSINELNLKR